MGIATRSGAYADSVAARTDATNRLRRELGDAVDTETRRRAEYSSDASNYRVVPDAVVFPRSRDDVIATLEIARETGTPLTTRGAGTSVAGNAIGAGIVMDFSRHLNRIVDLDPETRTARVEAGVVLGSLQGAASAHGLRFGPDPSTWARCTIGGMIGNNACGAHSLLHGRTADNVLELDVVDGLGRQFTAGTDLSVVPGLQDLINRNLATVRTEFGRFGRQVSGYSLEHLLPERGHDLAKALVGTEGTCAIVLEATVQLVDLAQAPLLVALGYESMIAAADDVPTLLEHRPGAIEGLDARLVDRVRLAHGAQSVAALPRGAGWLLVEVTGTDAATTAARAARLIEASAAVDARVVPPGPEQRSIWRIREDGVGLAGRTTDGRPAWPGFEDAAVPPEQLGAYLRDLEPLLDRHGVQAMPYGHFGDGCLHMRLDFPLERDGAALRRFMLDAAALVAEYGGSISGEHGDGRARSELLPLMYSKDALAAFGAFKHCFDPDNILNPGVLVDPRPLDADLRMPAALPIARVGGRALAHDHGEFSSAVHRCVGVGRCRADTTVDGGFMCPSYLATADEKDSTRGRARVLQEMLNGSLVDGGWRSPEVHDALDLCLSCKACASDCPAGVDMATMKSEVLHQRYRGRIRPVTHYVLGWLPRWARLTAPLTAVVNPVLSIPPLRRLVLRLGGMDSRRGIPRFAPRFTTSRAARQLRSAPSGARDVLLWVDSFSDCFDPAIAADAVTVLRDAGFNPILPERAPCCGLTWITTGQLDGARRHLRALVDELHPFVDADVPIVGLEPSCTAVLRDELVELLPADHRARDVATNTFTLAELLAARAPEWTPPPLADEHLIVQPHCHHHAVMGFDAERALLNETGAEIVELAGCCGLAGDFGMTRGHHEVSVAVAERALLPALRADASAQLVADGFSCRTQAHQLASRDGAHLAQVLASAIRKRDEHARA